MSNASAAASRGIDRLWVRLLGMAMAGAGAAMLVHGVAVLVAPTVESPTAVVSSVDHLGRTCYSRPRHCDSAFRSQAVAPDGTLFDLPGQLEIAPGRLLRVERSAVGGQIVVVRFPDGEHDLRTDTNALAKLGIAVVLLGVGVGLGLRRSRERPALLWGVFVLVALVAAAPQFAPAEPRSADPPERPPSAMQGYGEPPTAPAADPRRPGLRVSTIVGRGVEAPGSAAGLTVTGPVVSGPPPGAAPDAGRGFDLVSVPVRATRAGADGPGTVGLPNVTLLGDGVGEAVWLYGDRTCGAAPGLFPGRFQAPREGYLCFAVAPGFVPRYLVLVNDDVAVDLRRGPAS